VHPGEASHGDLGMITDADVVLALSYSGESDEINMIMPVLKRQGNAIISMTGKPQSRLAGFSDVHLNVAVPEEACPHGLAPTSSTTVSLALGDALAVALLEARGFSSEDFARSHPAGSLGRRLLVRIDDLMHQGPDLPAVTSDASVTEALLEISQKRLGMTAVLDAERRLLGVFTDGDLRRALGNGPIDFNTTPVSALMAKQPKTVPAGHLAVEAAHLLEQHRINGLLVVDADGRCVGALNIHDLLQARVV
jgi:arabinose-5-phosphate isomerase